MKLLIFLLVLYASIFYPAAEYKQPLRDLKI